MALYFRSSAHSEIGLVRKNNQDSAYASSDLVIVADGMGGAAAGDLASAVAIAEVVALDAQLSAGLDGQPPAPPSATDAADLADAPDASADAPDASADAPTATTMPATPASAAGDDDDLLADALLTALDDTVARANARLAALVAGEPSLDGMGTTLCGFVLHDGLSALVNIGDSRAYLIRDDELMRVSHDHSWVQTLVDAGRLTEEEALEHPHRSLILRVINGKPGHEPDLEVVDLRAGDRVLVCSDGLCGLVTDEQIASRMGSADRDIVVASLVDLAHAAGGYDNITVIVADVLEGTPTDEPRILGAAEETLLTAGRDDTAPLPVVPSPRRRRSGATATASAGAGRRRGRPLLRTLAAVILPVALLLGGGFAWYSYTQTRFYLGPNNGTTVALYQGVPDTILGVPLSHVVDDQGVQLANLPPFYLDKVNGHIAVDSLATGQARLAELKVVAARCQAQREAHARATESPSPTPSGSASPSGSPTATPTVIVSPTAATPGPTPSATPTVPSAAEEC